MYLGSKIFNGTVVLGKIIKLERGKTGIVRKQRFKYEKREIRRNFKYLYFRQL